MPPAAIAGSRPRMSSKVLYGGQYGPIHAICRFFAKGGSFCGAWTTPPATHISLSDAIASAHESVRPAPRGR